MPPYITPREGVESGEHGFGRTQERPSPTDGQVIATPSDVEFSQVVLRPLVFRLEARAGVGENVAIGQPLRVALETALREAAYRLERSDAALRELFLAMKAEDTPLRIRTGGAVLQAKRILFPTGG